MKVKSNSKYFIIVIPLALIAVISILLYRSPQYSLYQIRRAVLQRDYEQFSKYVDVDCIIDNIWEDALEDNDTDDTWISGLIDIFSNNLKETLKSSFRSGVEDGEYADSWMGDLSIWNSITKVSIQRHGKVSEVTLIGDEGDFEFSMRDKGGYWEIFKINTVDDFVTEESIDIEDSDEIVVFDKEIGEQVELATINFTINSFSEISEIPEVFLDPIIPQDGYNLYKLNATIRSTNSDGFYVDNGVFIIADSDGFQYEPIESFGIDDEDLLTYEEIYPNLSKKGNIYYELPEDSIGLRVIMGKLGTNEDYHVDLGL